MVYRRSQEEMMGLILGFARRDARIRALYLNGLRADPAARRDDFQDYDIVYAVSATRPFIDDQSWLAGFGDVLIQQQPDRSVLFDGCDWEERYGFLVLFADGNRIDFSLQSLSYSLKTYGEDSQTVPLLDKDGLLPAIPAASDRAHHVKPPTAEAFRDCCNEFWWVATYIAKGLWRREVLYAMDHMNLYVRPMLLKMLDWYAGSQTGYTMSTGKCGKHLRRYLPQDMWQALLRTYAPAREEELWAALFAMTELFAGVSARVAQSSGFRLNTQEAQNVTSYLRRVQKDWQNKLA
ncbi:MAG: aminoglycoside 6-adenylyltransferase [Eubacteriales bacterium]|nr:aminoglycoside 6-adenylyltransferase [Eubacteriales bacterium]